MISNRKIFFWSLIVALGGFLFGFDTAVISGAEQSIQTYWQLNSFQHGLTISIALVGTILGALGGSIPSDRWGRKKTLIGIAVLYLFSSLGSAFATDWWLFLFCRFIGGVGVGASSVAAPVYISEIAPPERRGRLVAMFQFNVVFGILVSYFSNWLIGRTGESAWRVMLGVQAIPSFIFLVLLRLVPETPRWLSQRGRQLVEKEEDEALLQKKYRFPIFLAVMFAIFNQVSGINAIIYYAPRIFEMTGLGRSSSLLSTAGLGLVNFVFTLIAINFIDRIGRRSLMLIGSCGLIAMLGMVSASFYLHLTDGIWVVVCLLVYIAFFAFSQGAVIWVFISEIFPTKVRAKGQTLGSFTHWVMAAVVAFAFPIVAEKAGGGHTFLFFSVMMCCQLLFVWKYMPETKGQSLEQIERTLILH